MTVSGLVEFLLSRLDADEAVARRFDGTAFREWTYRPYGDRLGGEAVPMGGQVTIAADWHGAGYVAVSEHIARHDPARVLADVAAKRAIIELHTHEDGACWGMHRGVYGPGWPEGSYAVEGAEWAHPSLEYLPERNDPCDTVRLLASVYAAHPDFDPGWLT